MAAAPPAPHVNPAFFPPHSAPPPAAAVAAVASAAPPHYSGPPPTHPVSKCNLIYFNEFKT